VCIDSIPEWLVHLQSSPDYIEPSMPVEPRKRSDFFRVRYFGGVRNLFRVACTPAIYYADRHLFLAVSNKGIRIMKSIPWLSALFLLGFAPTSVDAQPGAHQPGKANGPLRIAMVSSGTGDSINALLDLAQAKVSTQPGVELLERKAIVRVLQEQKLSLSGLVDANTAVRAGKLLSVDLFAFVEADPTSKDALGLIVYDAATGVKLHDAALPTGKLNEQIEAVSSGVRRAADKEAAGIKGLRTVCLLSVRNADLPRAQDSLAHTIGFLMERQLLGSPKLAVLERKRLDFVTKEKALASDTRNKELLASLVMIDVEISRAGTGKAVRATAFLTDNEGKQLGKVQVEEAEPQAVLLAEKLQKALWRYWQADPPAKAADPVRESKRFHQEGKRLHSQKEWHAAVQALDAAYALNPKQPPVELDPRQPQLRFDLAKSLGDLGYAIQVPGPRPEINKTGKLQVTAERFKDALAVGLRSLEMRRLALQGTPPKDFRTLHNYSVRYAFAADAPPNRQFITNLKTVDPLAVDEEAAQLRQQFYDQYHQLIREELDRWTEVARADCQVPKSSSAFNLFTMAIQRASQMLMQARVEKTDVDLFLLPYFRPWLEVSQLPGASQPNYLLSQFCQENVPIRSEYAVFYAGLAKHSNPILKLYGRWYRLRLDMKEEKIPAGPAQLAYQEVRQDAFKILSDHKPVPGVFPQEDIRTNMYLFLYMALDQWPYPNPDQRHHERFALIDQMLTRQEMVVPLVIRALQPEFNAKNLWHSQRWDLAERALKLLAAGKPQLCDNPSYLSFQLRDMQKQILMERPEFAQKAAPAAALWSQADQLLSLNTIAMNQTGVPQVEGDDIYLAGAGSEAGNYVLQLLRFSVTNKTKQPLGKVVLRPALERERSLAFNQIVATTLSSTHVYVATKSDGIYAFDRASTAVKHISKDLPSQEIEAMTYHAGKLFVALRGGFLLAFDPDNGAVETLAASRRRERLSPFDNDEVFRIPYLVMDAKRHRLLFLLYQKPNQLIYYPSAMIPPKDTTNGLWEYNFKTKTFKRNLELYYEAFLWGSPIRDDRLLLSKTGYHRTGVMDFDLARNQGKLLWAVNLIGPTVAKESAAIQADYYPFGNVQMQRGEWLWNAHPLSRASLKERRQEFTPPLGETPQTYSTTGIALVPVGSDQLLLSNPSGLWLLKLTKGN
jgi:hypothetical protein